MANDLLKITTPRGAVKQVRNSTGEVSCKIEWAPGFGRDWAQRLTGAQAMFDQEVLRRTDPYVPLDTGMLKNTALLASDIGGGELVWSTPYAAAQYYNTASSRPYDALRGGHWAERMKADHLPQLQDFARKAVQMSK